MRLATAAVTGAPGIVVLALDPHKVEFNDTIILYCSKAGASNQTAQVDATISDLGANIPVALSRSGTTVTVTFPATQPHRLGSAVDYITISGSGVASLDGTYQVATVTSDTVLTYTSGTSATTTANAIAVPIRFLETIIASGTPAITVTGPTAPSATTRYIPTTVLSGLILNVTANTAGTCYLDVRQSGAGL